MKQANHCQGPWVRLAICTLLASPLQVPIAAGDDSSQQHPAQQLSEFAQAGQFDRALALLRADMFTRGDRLASLISDLERHDTHSRQWRQQRKTAASFAYGEMIALANDDHVEDALVFAIEAHGLAAEKQAFLEDPQVHRLVQLAQTAASEAEQQGDWVAATSLYRRLDLLFDDPNSRHHEKLQEAAAHIRVMRLYTPRRLMALYEQRALERGEDIDPVNLADETWQQRLENITKPMLIQALVEAEQRHVSNPRFDTMLAGAIDALLVLINTTGLENVFPTLATPEADSWRHKLLRQRARLAAADSDLTRHEMRSLVRQILKKNKAKPRLPERVLVYEMTEGALGTLDEFTSVIWPYNQEQFRRNTKGKFFGVGIQISMTIGPLTVTEVQQHSDAKVGIESGDVVATIDGRDVSGYSPSYVMWKLHGERGKGLELGIERDGATIELALQQGASLRVKRPMGRLTVKSPLRGTPAYRSGILADDVITIVDEQSTEGWTLEQAVRKITGPLGTIVTLGIDRKDESELQEILIKRAEIEIESVKGWRLNEDDTWDFYIDRANRLGYVRLTQFIPQSSDELDDAINQLEADAGVDGLVLDLRFNPGGLLNKAVDVTDRFLDHGTIVSTVDSKGNVTDPRSARPHHTHRWFPLVVLINQGSASASEIVSGALQDYGRATISGSRSFGKGSVQDLFPLHASRALLKLTTQYYRLPKGRIIHRASQSKQWGIEPDIVVDMTDDQVRELVRFRQDADVLRNRNDPSVSNADPEKILSAGMDPQLEAALLMLKTMMVADTLELARKPHPISTP